MMRLLNAEGAWLAIGVSVLFIVVGVAMKRVIVNVLKRPAPDAAPPCALPETLKHD